MNAMPLIRCCGLATCNRCLGRELIPCPEALKQFHQQRAFPDKPPRLALTSLPLGTEQLLERAYALSEFDTLQEAADAFGIHQGSMRMTLYRGMKKRGFPVKNAKTASLKRHIKSFIDFLESEMEFKAK
jgi:hypothetical protein